MLLYIILFVLLCSDQNDRIQASIFRLCTEKATPEEVAHNPTIYTFLIVLQQHPPRSANARIISSVKLRAQKHTARPLEQLARHPGLPTATISHQMSAPVGENALSKLQFCICSVLIRGNLAVGIVQLPHFQEFDHILTAIR